MSIDHSSSTTSIDGPRKAPWARGLLVAAVGVATATGSFAVPGPSAGAASGVVNDYVAASVSGGVPDTSVLSSADCALVIQMTGTVADGLGTFEVLDPATSAPERSYSDTEKVQFVVLPGGCANAQVVDGGGVQAAPWNGDTGGVVFLGGPSITLEDDISASGAGYTPELGAGAGSDGVTGGLSNGNSSPSLVDAVAGGGGGGGGITGGGGGGGGANSARFSSNDAIQGGGGTIAAAGTGGFSLAGSGGAPGAVGNGANSPIPSISNASSNVNYTGAGGGGGGGYGAGGGSCGSHFAGAYAAGGGGGGAWTGGGAGGRGGTNTGNGVVNPDGLAGNAPSAVPIDDADHYLHHGDARLMMGGAGGHHMEGAGGGAGGGIVVLVSDVIIGNGHRISADGRTGGQTSVGPASGAGGGGGGQLYLGATSLSGLTATANGGNGGRNVLGTVHTGSYGASGGGGGIWFAGAAPAAATNTGGANAPVGSGSDLGLGGVTWQVLPGGPQQLPSTTVTIGGVVYTQDDWIGAYNTAGAHSMNTGVVMAVALAETLGVDESEITALFPELAAPDNPKNAGLGCSPGLGGAGLASVTAPVAPPVSSTTTTTTSPSSSTTSPTTSSVPTTSTPVGPQDRLGGTSENDPAGVVGTGDERARELALTGLDATGWMLLLGATLIGGGGVMVCLERRASAP